MTAPLKIAIAMPVYGDVPAGFMYDYGRLMAFSALQLVAPGHADIVPNMIQGTYLDVARDSLVRQAGVTECTHILWLDTDMRFPKDSLVRLLNHHKPIVATNYCTRRFPLEPVAFKRVDVSPEGLHVRLWTKPDSTGTEEVDAAGMGLMLVEQRVFAETPQPWFPVGSRNGCDLRDDVAFCLAAKGVGYPTLIDHDLSKEIRHIGQFEFRMEHAQAFADGQRMGQEG